MSGTLDLYAIAKSYYPKIDDCQNGHIGKDVKCFFTEDDDDRYWIMVGSRCGHCNMPTGGDDYADSEDKERYYKGLPPKGASSEKSTV